MLQEEDNADGGMLCFDPPLSVFDNIQIQEMLLSQLQYLEEKQMPQMYRYHLQSAQLRDQCNPLVARLLDLQKRKSVVIGEEVNEQKRNLKDCLEKPSGNATVEDVPDVQLKKREAADKNTAQKSVESPSFREEAKVSKIKLRKLGESSSWEILTPSDESNCENGLPSDEPKDKEYKNFCDGRGKEGYRMKTSG